MRKVRLRKMKSFALDTQLIRDSFRIMNPGYLIIILGIPEKVLF